MVRKSNRLKKLKGIYKDEDFNKVYSQLNGRAILLIVIINNNCKECEKLVRFTQQLENGFIDKLPQLVMLYGHSTMPLEPSQDRSNEKQDSKNENDDQKDEEKILGNSSDIAWHKIPGGHGYCFFLSETEQTIYQDVFDHDDFGKSVLDNLRRFKSSIRTLAGLSAKRKFIDSKGTGIIVETNSSTTQENIIALEEKIKIFKDKIKIPVYFCKGIAQEMSLISRGEIKLKNKGLNIEKFLRKVAK
ncbi:MAG: hypothetical protein GY786_14585 [Proteobacteria bacterium]|nr:hypothetical protein [Pseudomonadota bacterium]